MVPPTQGVVNAKHACWRLAARVQAYQRACSLSDAADGDDVPGLLLNWARGLLAMAQQAQVGWGGARAGHAVPALVCYSGRRLPSAASLPSQPMCVQECACLLLASPQPAPPPCPGVQDPALALALLGEAERRLQQSADFLRGSHEPLLALGDVLLERGEQLAAGGDLQGAAASLQRALGEGYHAAQRIRAQSPEAAVGVADVEVQLARLATAAGQAEAAAGHWAAAEAAYGAALQQAAAFDFQERCDVRYNLACCQARCGRHAAGGGSAAPAAGAGGGVGCGRCGGC